jgi:hypothetical protein
MVRKKETGVGETMQRVMDRVRGWPKPLRVGAGLLLVAAGCVGFLPVLGFWMIPAGLLILAIDIPWLQGPVKRAEKWMMRALRRFDAWRAQAF